MITVPEATPQRLVLQAKAAPEPGRGAAYIGLGLVFIAIGAQQGRGLLVVLGILNALFSIMSFRPLKDDATATLDRTTGTLVYETRNIGGESAVTIPLQDVVSGELEVRRTMFRSLFRLQLVLANGQKLPLGYAPDRTRADKEAAAGHLRLFLNPAG